MRNSMPPYSSYSKLTTNFQKKREERSPSKFIVNFEQDFLLTEYLNN